jgi:hypothetical protein
MVDRFKKGDYILGYSEDNIIYHGQIYELTDKRIYIRWFDWTDILNNNEFDYSIEIFKDWVDCGKITLDICKNRDMKLKELFE